MLEFFNNTISLIGSRFICFANCWQCYLIVLALSIATMFAVILIVDSITKYKKQTVVLVSICKLITIICLYAAFLFWIWLLNKTFVKCRNDSRLFLDSAILTISFIILIKVIKIVIIKPIQFVITFITTLFHKEATSKNKSVSMQEIEQICMGFTRTWIVNKLKQFPELDRYQILVNNKNEYIEELVYILPKNYNRHRLANKYYSYYCNLWK